MAFELPPLPYSMDALAPHFSEETLQYHYGKHHKAYVDNLNKLIAGTEMEQKSLEDIIKHSTGTIFNNAAQIWNHTFFWHSISPNGGKTPSGEMLEIIENSFGSYDKFKELFAQKAISQFGSGWAWLIKNANNKLEIISTSNADTPVREGQIPLITCDVWEHAYYIDYRNQRPVYVEHFFELINWDFALKNFKAML